jgi:archaellum component FlaF (FlaF/FlaG flagellin family)
MEIKTPIGKIMINVVEALFFGIIASALFSGFKVRLNGIPLGGTIAGVVMLAIAALFIFAAYKTAKNSSNLRNVLQDQQESAEEQPTLNPPANLIIRAGDVWKDIVSVTITLNGDKIGELTKEEPIVSDLLVSDNVLMVLKTEKYGSWELAAQHEFSIKPGEKIVFATDTRPADTHIEVVDE